MKRILLLAFVAIFVMPTVSAQVTDFYQPGGFDNNGASIKTFSVSDNVAVQFSRGNLQYNPSLDKWRFALRQYNFACGDNTNIAQDYDGWIDIFGWGTSGWNSGATAYQPWSTSNTGDFLDGSTTSSLTGAYANADWGIYNKIENGGKYAGMWRTLTKDEWEYLLGDNMKRQGKWSVACIGGVYNGMLLLPDEWVLPTGCRYTAGGGSQFSFNSYTFAEWEKMETAGAVFLPAAGSTNGTEYGASNQGGFYWTSTAASPNINVLLYSFDDFMLMDVNNRAMASVRLVRRVAPGRNKTRGTWVNLGLPSGTLWYSCNVGATRPEEYGDYFAWGETKPKPDYSWSNYKYGRASDSLTKYCNSESLGLNGYSDTLTVLEPGDDASTAALGRNARTPTYDEWMEMMEYSTMEWTTLNGVNGFQFTSNTNGKTLFFPAAGGYVTNDWHQGLSGAGEGGAYWSSFLTPIMCQIGLIEMTNFNDTAYWNGGKTDRFNGLSVRAVRSGTHTTEATVEAFDTNGASLKGFSVGEGTAVHFSKGNLQYNAAQDTWRFAENQYDYVGEDNSNISSSYNGWIDLFGWGTSGWNSGANAYQPWATSETSSDYYPGGSYTNSLTGAYANADWGVYNAISNGGNQAGMWRTLTSDEWEYLLNTRSASTVGGTANARYAVATVGDIAGVIILPDSFTMPTGVNELVSINTADADFTDNTYTTEQWTALETAGAIFLPAAGYRNGTGVSRAGTVGDYWTSTHNNENYAYCMNFYESELDMNIGGRSGGRSVRLVKD
ncbi:MAG: hypothetical protein J5711_03885 [Bacteroidales bacterium]|nr:hypothetical protein [Bacteroidales bacterium]